MHGMGDCLHQRAVLRQLMQRYSITLETSWPSIYHDLIEEGLCVTRRPVALRTQTKNASRESECVLFSPRHAFARGGVRISYGADQILGSKSKTILEAMCDATGTDYEQADFRLPVPRVWEAALWEKLGPLPARAEQYPWLVYRPLVARHEWKGSIARNADPAAYEELFASIRDKFFVVSVADLEDGREWLVSPSGPAPDLALHKGELVFEEMAALFAQANMVFTSSGFAAILGPAVETTTVSIVGGYESTGCHDSGKKFAPYLAIGPVRECGCWTSVCKRACDKTIDMSVARSALLDFVEKNAP
jgi:hypothetical protein